MAKPGGVVAYHEAVWPTTFDPPLDAWDRLYGIFRAYADGNGIDLFIGRRVPRLLASTDLLMCRRARSPTCIRSATLAVPSCWSSPTT